MAPKFKGGSDDWLDDQKSRGPRSTGGRVRGKPQAAPALPWARANATVAEVFPKRCRVVLDDDGGGGQGGSELLCDYRRAGAGVHARLERSPVAVGDRVLVERSGDGGVVEGICERRNRLSRPAPGREGREGAAPQHVVAANVDCLVVVDSARMPEFSPGLVDRFLVAAAAAGIPAILCVTKIDLADARAKPWDVYRALGFEVAEVCAKSGVGVVELRARLTGLTAVFCGHSGVGKTTLLSVLVGTDVGRVGEVSALTGKGRHTTTGAVMLHAPGASRWVDTPGVREFGLSDVPPMKLAVLFPEFHALECETVACIHENEPGCAARALPRYESYRRILDSLRDAACIKK